jgi:S1-C subfamily serine protease
MTHPQTPPTQPSDTLWGDLTAVDTVLQALLASLPAAHRHALRAALDGHIDSARRTLEEGDPGASSIAHFDQRLSRLRDALGTSASPPKPEPRPVEPVLLTTTRLSTFVGDSALSGASGFFFRRDEQLFLITNRHVLIDEPSGHAPDRIELELHTDARDLTQRAIFSIPLYRDGLSVWRQAIDGTGEVDVAAIRIDTERLPAETVLHAFEPEHLDAEGESVAIGDALTVIGFPLGFHDTVHHLAVARRASIASAYGVRFQQQGYFLTDARTHRGSSGAPVLRRRTRTTTANAELPWQLLGVHSSRMDMRSRDLALDESLGLNAVWYADILLTLTEPRPLAE